jgi:uncharacterized phage protein gp47/JayE
MIDLSLKTFKLILSDMLDRVSSEYNKRDGSLIKTSLAAAAWAIEGIYLELAYIQKQAYGLFATGEYLDYKVAEAGLERKQSVNAVRYARFNLNPPVGTTFQVADIDEKVYYILESAAEYVIDESYPDEPYLGLVTCVQSGNIGNVYSGRMLCSSFVAGLTNALLLGIHTQGLDQESDDALRDRYKLAIGKVEFGGNINAYRNFILAQQGVGAVQVYPVWNGPGTVLCSVVNSDYKALTADEINALQMIVCPPTEGLDYPSKNGYGMAPIGATVTITTATQVNVSVTGKVYIKTGSGKTIESINAQAETDINKYISDLCSGWGNMGSWRSVDYSMAVYINKIIGIINSIDGVEVADDIKINGSASNLVFTEVGEIGGQQIPVFNDVTLTQG